MAFIPDDARWYLADVVLEHIIEDDPRNVVHINTHLIEADSPAQAYKKAIALGRRARSSYVNTEGKQVRVIFRGLQQLNVIHEPLEDGSELTYHERVNVSEKRLKGMITPRSKLAVFAPIEARRVPNYAPDSILQLMEKDLGPQAAESLRSLIKVQSRRRKSRQSGGKR